MTASKFNICPLNGRQACKTSMVTGSEAEALTSTQSSHCLCCHGDSCQQLANGGGVRRGRVCGGGSGQLTDSCDRYIILSSARAHTQYRVRQVSPAERGEGAEFACPRCGRRQLTRTSNDTLHQSATEGDVGCVIPSSLLPSLPRSRTET